VFTFKEGVGIQMSNSPSVDSLFRSQWGQDRFIFEYLMDFQNGTFFEVGAHEGELLSNTFFLEKALNWSGILVEMQPRFFEGIRKKRSRAKVFSCGLAPASASILWFDAGDRSGLLRYFEHSGFEYLETHYRDTEPKPAFQVKWVQVRPLMDVAAEAGISHIDYFSLDVEGGEMAILKSIDFDRLTIDLFTIEDNTASWTEHRSFLEPLGYTCIGGLGIDDFFLHHRFITRLAQERGADHLAAVCAKLQPIRTSPSSTNQRPSGPTMPMSLGIATTNTPPPHGKPAPGLQVVRRATSASRLVSMRFGPYGADVATQASPPGRVREIGWTVRCSDGLHEVWVEYAAAEIRPMNLLVDGRQVVARALWECGSGWGERHQMWRYQCVAHLDAGQHDVVLVSEGAAPAVRCLALLPVVAESGMPDSDARFATPFRTPPDVSAIRDDNRMISHLKIPPSINLPPVAHALLGSIRTELALADTAYNREAAEALDAAYHYLSCGASSINIVWSSIQLAEPTDVRSVLDFGGAYGRSLRWLRAAFPQADVAVAEIMPEAIAFCEASLGATNCWLSGMDIDALTAPMTYDLIWAGSVLTHLSADDNRRLLRKFVNWLSPGGVAVVTTHGRRVAARETGKGYIAHPLWQKILIGYRDAGFGYSDYHGQPGWGVSIATPTWMMNAMEEIPGTRIVSAAESAWDRHQDVYALQKLRD
jgi:FkbM family methyltransferase